MAMTVTFTATGDLQEAFGYALANPNALILMAIYTFLAYIAITFHMALVKEFGELLSAGHKTEQLKGLSGEEATKRQALLDARIEEVGLAQAQREIEKGGVEELEKQAGIQTSFNQSILELKDALANGILPLFSQVAGFLSSHMGVVKTLLGLYIAMKGIILASNVATAAGILLSKKQAKESKKDATNEITGGAFKMASGLGPLGIAVVAGLIGAGMTYLAMSGNDIMSPGGSGGGYGNRTLFGPEGAIQLNNKEHFMYKCKRAVADRFRNRRGRRCISRSSSFSR
jgi:hypothetical protein